MSTAIATISIAICARSLLGRARDTCSVRSKSLTDNVPDAR
jgi:hypothetical protein